MLLDSVAEKYRSTDYSPHLIMDVSAFGNFIPYHGPIPFFYHPLTSWQAFPWAVLSLEEFVPLRGKEVNQESSPH